MNTDTVGATFMIVATVFGAIIALYWLLLPFLILSRLDRIHKSLERIRKGDNTK